MLLWAKQLCHLAAKFNEMKQRKNAYDVRQLEKTYCIKEKYLQL